MEEKQKMANLVQKSGTYNYKLIIPEEVEKKIRFTCQKVWDTEWSGTLFFTHEGSFENNDLVIKCVDIYIMDIGTQAYTEFDMNPDVIAYMCNNPELLDCQIGLIHSHAALSTFFSSTDIATLKEEGKDRNNFVSLIVNNAGTYTAAITRRVKTKQVRESVSYEFFGDGEKSDIKEFTSNVDEIEWFYLKIEKEGENYSFPNIDTRLEEIKRQKAEKVKKAKKVNTTILKYVNQYSNIPISHPVNANENKVKQEYTQRTLFDDINESRYPFEDLDTVIPYDNVNVNPKTIESLIKQLITCSIIIPNESKIDINKWVENMPILYEKRFGKGDVGMKNFREWADIYTEFLTWNIEDTDLISMKFNQTDIQSIYAHNLIEALTKLPENDYIKVYINELEKYLII